MHVASLTGESLREEHRRVREQLEHAEILADVLPRGKLSQQRKTMQMIGVALDECVRAHTEWEERVLYPLLRDTPGGGGASFTASLSYERGIASRWIDELIREAGARRPDVRGFRHHVDRVLGLLAAHLEEEEQLLAPLPALLRRVAH